MVQAWGVGGIGSSIAVKTFISDPTGQGLRAISSTALSLQGEPSTANKIFIESPIWDVSVFSARIHPWTALAVPLGTAWFHLAFAKMPPILVARYFSKDVVFRAPEA